MRKKGTATGSPLRQRRPRSVSRGRKDSTRRKNIFAALNKRIEVFWPDDNKFYRGTVGGTYDAKGRVEVVYDDGDVEVLDLNKEKWNYC